MSTYLELEIQNLLNEVEDLDQVGTRLIQNLESSPEHFTRDNLNALARFLLKAQLPHKLIDFVIQHIENESFPVPWPYFLEALHAVQVELDEKIIKALGEGIEEENAETEAARSLVLKDAIPLLGEWRSNRKYRIHKDYLNNKKLLLEQLITLRTQQLYEQEKNLLQRLQKLYPGDSEIRSEVNEHKQRYALEILQRRSPKKRAVKIDDFISKDPEVDKALEALLVSLRETAKQNPDMAFDFAVVAFMLESYETSLELLSLCENSDALLWFRLEVLLKCRRFVELLNELSRVEMVLAHEPETFFATAYLRAQALWGLGQKHTAVEVLEGLLASRPHYRAAHALLSIWSGQ